MEGVKRIAFHCNQLSLRGTEVAMYDYAHYNEKILGNKSIIITKNPSEWPYSDKLAIEKFEKRFNVFYYKSVIELERILMENMIDIFYTQKAGNFDHVLSYRRKTVVHAVFQNYEPHGDVYAFISEWLSEVYENKHDFVPYMVDLPEVNTNLREFLNIPADAYVFGRHGGYETFDIPFVKEYITRFIDTRTDIYFLFMNTEKFIDHPRVIFLNPSADLHYKVTFINTCTAMIHARVKGETFGLAVAEFSLKNKPIITYRHSIDRAHEMILKDRGFYYGNILELSDIFTNIDKYFSKENLSYDWNAYSDYTPEKIMNKFKKVFID
jgi:hypothetical protein